MEPITEDYVSFEAAKLAWEKGLRQNCKKLYTYSERIDGVKNTIESEGDYTVAHIEACNNSTKTWQWNYMKYTQALVIKWLRIKHNIHIYTDKHYVYYKTEGKYFYIAHIQMHGIEGSSEIKTIKLVNLSPYDGKGLDAEYQFYRTPSSPEEATEAAILYSLQNLIK